MHDPVRAVPEWSQVEEQGKWRQKGRKEECEAKADLTSEFVFTWGGVELFAGVTELANKENTLILHWHNGTIEDLSSMIYYSALVNGPI